jgi:hypothetical protein
MFVHAVVVLIPLNAILLVPVVTHPARDSLITAGSSVSSAARGGAQRRSLHHPARQPLDAQLCTEIELGITYLAWLPAGRPRTPAGAAEPRRRPDRTHHRERVTELRPAPLRRPGGRTAGDHRDREPAWSR